MLREIRRKEQRKWTDLKVSRLQTLKKRTKKKQLFILFRYVDLSRLNNGLFVWLGDNKGEVKKVKMAAKA